MNYEDSTLEELEKDILVSKRMLPYLFGAVYKSYEGWIIKKEERVKFLKEQCEINKISNI